MCIPEKPLRGLTSGNDMIKYVFLKDHTSYIMENGLKGLKNGNVNMGKVAQFFKAGIAHRDSSWF